MTTDDQVTIDPPTTGAVPRPEQAGVRRIVVGSDELVVKRGSGRDRARLRHEADLLRRLAGARVVDVVEVREHDDLTEVVLADAGPRTLADLDPSNGDLTLRALQRLAEAVADLHERGWSHGAICAEHAVVNRRGNVRLCSLGSARPAGGAAGDVDDDLCALLSVVEHVARGRGTGGGPLERLDQARRSRRLERFAGRARSALDHGEIDAATMARELRDLRRGAPTSSARAAGNVVRPRTLVLGTLCAVAAIAFACSALGPAPDERRAAPATTPSPAPATSTTVGAGNAATTRSVVTAADTSGSCAGPSVDIDGDGCDDTVRLDGEIVEVGGTRYALGIPGDTAVVGDWDCDGIATARLLRGTSGEVFEFDTWATTDGDELGRLVGTVEGAVGIVRGDDPTEIGCDVLHVVAADGSQEELRL